MPAPGPPLDRSEATKETLASSSFGRVREGAALVLLVLYALALLTIGISRDWRLVHEDNGAIQTTFALSHLKLGLAGTRAHDVFFNPRTGKASAYGHHPPGTALLVAAGFSLARSTEPWAARATVILFHVGSLLFLFQLLRFFLSFGVALCGALVAATLPMSSFFGRMVNYEPFCLFAVLLLLTSWVVWRRDRSTVALAGAVLGIVVGGLIDWAMFFFAFAIFAVEVRDAARRRPRTFGSAALLLAAIASVFLWDVWHLWYASRGSLSTLREVLPGSGASHAFWPSRFLSGQLENFRRYYSHAGAGAVLLVIACLVAPHRPLSQQLFDVKEAFLLERLLVVLVAAPALYVFCAPWWAGHHHYWQFYFLPFVVFSMALVGRLLWRKSEQTGLARYRVALFVAALEVLITSTYILVTRHTTPGDFAIRKTAALRAEYLAPRDVSFRTPDR